MKKLQLAKQCINVVELEKFFKLKSNSFFRSAKLIYFRLESPTACDFQGVTDSASRKLEVTLFTGASRGIALEETLRVLESVWKTNDHRNVYFQNSILSISQQINYPPRIALI